MSTWDDKPNDYEHAAAQLVQCQLQLENAGYTLEKQWQDIMVLKDEVLQAKAESSAKRVVIVRLLDALSEIEKHAGLYAGDRRHHPQGDCGDMKNFWSALQIPEVFGFALGVCASLAVISLIVILAIWL